MDLVLCSSFLYLDVASKKNMQKNMLVHYMISIVALFVLGVHIVFRDTPSWILFAGLGVISILLLALYFIFVKNFSPSKVILFDAFCMLIASVDFFAMMYQYIIHPSNNAYNIISYICVFFLLVFILYRAVFYKKGLFRKKEKNDPKSVTVKSGILAGVLVITVRMIISFLKKSTGNELSLLNIMILFLPFIFLGIGLMYLHNFIVAKREKIDVKYKEQTE